MRAAPAAPAAQGMHNPLDGVKVAQREGSGSGTFQYFLKASRAPEAFLPEVFLFGNAFALRESAFEALLPQGKSSASSPPVGLEAPA